MNPFHKAYQCTNLNDVFVIKGNLHRPAFGMHVEMLVNLKRRIIEKGNDIENCRGLGHDIRLVEQATIMVAKSMAKSHGLICGTQTGTEQAC
jgi:hypothetical protein